MMRLRSWRTLSEFNLWRPARRTRTTLSRRSWPWLPRSRHALDRRRQLLLRQDVARLALELMPTAVEDAAEWQHLRRSSFARRRFYDLVVWPCFSCIATFLMRLLQHS